MHQLLVGSAAVTNTPQISEACEYNTKFISHSYYVSSVASCGYTLHSGIEAEGAAPT
jgi:hypothetical protein